VKLFDDGCEALMLVPELGVWVEAGTRGVLQQYTEPHQDRRIAALQSYDHPFVLVKFNQVAQMDTLRYVSEFVSVALECCLQVSCPAIK
jgi:hypothetical protein